MGEAKTILVVEDTREFRELLQDILAKAGYRVVAAEDGRAGLQRLREERPDLVLLDIQMPHLSGYEVVRAARAEPGVARMPIILVSVQSKVAEIAHGLRLGADDYITKPFAPEEVLARVRALLRQAEGSAPA